MRERSPAAAAAAAAAGQEESAAAGGYIPTPTAGTARPEDYRG